MDVMFETLAAADRHPDLPEHLDVYARLLGSWHIENRFYDDADGAWRHHTRRWHFARILGGLGVQDVLSDEYGTGTTVRVFDRRAGLWRVGWYGPNSGQFATLLGGPAGDQIHQQGTGTDGRPIRWYFDAITADGFHWTGDVSADGGATWRLEQEMHAKRLT